MTNATNMSLDKDDCPFLGLARMSQKAFFHLKTLKETERSTVNFGVGFRQEAIGVFDRFSHF
jgi:hypothetical protein